jgi:hypothetical protein
MKTGSGFLRLWLWLWLSGPWVLAGLVVAYLVGWLLHPSLAVGLLLAGPPVLLAVLFGAVVWLMGATGD